jgi:hypothetical protein
VRREGIGSYGAAHDEQVLDVAVALDDLLRLHG